MSMRATFTTSFIYDGAEGYEDRWNKLCDVFDIKYRERAGGNVIGRISGVTKGMDLSEEDVRRYIEEIANELHDIAKVDFTVCWLLEGGDVIIRQIRGTSERETN